eukprot:TRINITY_DN17420_c0_g2_i2.p1 TRINITY_DN17420_c0_g2~~TRINITY_DN17420_c0_g2_i2.p1  ORF type:complete len:804 (-),score=130.76 TRINITY_DN17420_c0_g2_i2:181-2523(-)
MAPQALATLATMVAPSHATLAQLLRELRLAAGRPRARQIAAAAFALFLLPLLRLLIAARRSWAKRRALALQRARRCYLSVSSSLQGSEWKLAAPQGQRGAAADRWRCGCPCCKRPLEMRLTEPWQARQTPEAARGCFAFVISLWGQSIDYVLGALVLGHSLRRTGTKHSLVCLYTADVPARFVEILSRLWDCRLIEHINACTEALSYQEHGGQPHRFDKVFTKLRVMELTDFEKVLLMDIDLIVTGNIDNLFDLPAPAALRRGMNDNRWPLQTGDPIDGRAFFGAKDKGSKWSWGQGTGINAGVMLLQPDDQVFAQMMEEITEPNHPSHCRGNGPEQDYLSRFWADKPWTYIGVEFNYQLHQMFFSLHPKWAKNAERSAVIQNPESVKIVHFSGVPAAKPWHRVLDEKFSSFWPSRDRDAEYTRLFADEFLGHWLWVRKDRPTWEGMPEHHSRSEMQDLFLGADGEIYQRAWNADGPDVCVTPPSDVTQGAMRFLGWSLGIWFDCFEDLQRSLGTDVRNLLRNANVRSAPSDKAKSPQAESWAGTVQARSAKDNDTPSQWTSRGWWTEQSRRAEPASADQISKISVACNAVEGSAFVTFCEGGQETFGERDDEGPLAGIFVKVAGGHSARRFGTSLLLGSTDASSADAVGEDDGRIAECLSSLSIWANGVPAGAVVLLALIGLPQELLQRTLEVLAVLGVPQDLPAMPAGSCRALAAVGTRPFAESGSPAAAGSAGSGWFGEKRGNASDRVGRARPWTWTNCHASSDVAYAALLHVASTA